MVRVSGEFVVVGDIHGNLDDLIRIFQRYRYPPLARYVFLGDYVDRRSYSLETFVLLFTLQRLFPESVCLLRGNHEANSAAKTYGLKAECASRFGDSVVFGTVCDCFSALSSSCIINNGVFCVHSGVSEEAPLVDDLADWNASNIVADVIWSDPKSEIDIYSAKAVAQFLDRNGLSMMVRAQTYQPRGYNWDFGADGVCLTLFSSPG